MKRIPLAPYLAYWAAACLIVFAAVMAPAASGQTQECTEATVMEKLGHWIEGSPDLAFADQVVSKGRRAELLSKIDVIRDMFHEAVPQPLGVEASGYKSIRRFGSEIPDGPATYGFVSLYKTWLCNPRTHQLTLAGETGNWASVYINSLKSLVSEVGEMSIDGKPTMVYQLARRIGDLRGHVLYEAWGPWGAREGAVLYTRGDRFPFTPITQGQYLDGLELAWLAKEKSEGRLLDEAERSMEENLAEIKRTMTGETRDRIVAEIERGLAETRANKAKSRERLSAWVAEEIEYIKVYRSKHSPQELEQPAFLPEAMKMVFRGEFSEEATPAHLLVQVDLSYFQKDLSPEAAQLILLFWRWERDSKPSLHWRQTFEEHFPLEKLGTLLSR